MGPWQDIGVETSGFVTLVEIRRPPNNFFDIALIRELAGALEALDGDRSCRADRARRAGQSILRRRQFRGRQHLGPGGAAPG